MTPKNQATKGAEVSPALGGCLLNQGPGSRTPHHCQGQEAASIRNHCHPLTGSAAADSTKWMQITCSDLRKPVTDGWGLCSHQHPKTEAACLRKQQKQQTKGSLVFTKSTLNKCMSLGESTRGGPLTMWLSVASYKSSCKYVLLYPPTSTNTPSQQCERSESNLGSWTPLKNMPECGSVGELAPGSSFLPLVWPALPGALCLHAWPRVAKLCSHCKLSSSKPPLRALTLLNFTLGIYSPLWF